MYPSSMNKVILMNDFKIMTFLSFMLCKSQHDRTARDGMLGSWKKPNKTFPPEKEVVPSGPTATECRQKVIIPPRSSLEQNNPS